MKLYKYTWKNNARRQELFGRLCRIITMGKKNTVLVEFENGEKVTTSRYALLEQKGFAGGVS